MMMLMLSDMQGIPVPKLFRVQARAYLEAALQLTADLCEDRAASTATYADGAVTMSLANHAVELFLKGAILELKPGENFVAQGHELSQLEPWYRRLYPKKAFRLTMPAGVGKAYLVEPDPALERELAQHAASLRKRMPPTSSFATPRTARERLGNK